MYKKPFPASFYKVRNRLILVYLRLYTLKAFYYSAFKKIKTGKFFGREHLELNILKHLTFIIEKKISLGFMQNKQHKSIRSMNSAIYIAIGRSI